MSHDGCPKFRTFIIGVDQKNSTDIQNEEALQKVKSTFLVNTLQDDHNKKKQEANSDNDVKGNSVAFVVKCLDNEQDQPDKEKQAYPEPGLILQGSCEGFKEGLELINP